MTAHVTRIELPLERAYFWEKEHDADIFLTQPVNGIARDWTWAQAMDEARRMAAHLIAQNWPTGSRIVILSRNSAWWIMADLAIWMSGHISVPIYTSLPADSVRKLMEHCDPVACFIGPVDSAAPASDSVLSGLPSIRFPNAPPCRAQDWDEIVARQAPLPGQPSRLPSDVATIIYTSGTTASPKGVMHSFTAFAYFAKAVAQSAGENRQRCLSYLPLAHIAERALTETSGIYFGWRIFFSEGLATFLTDLQRSKATVFFSVPRLYTKLRQRVLEKIPQNKLDTLLRVPVLGGVAKKKILDELGLAHVQCASSGSAVLQVDLLLWYRNLGLPLAEGYGTSETGITHAPTGTRSKPGYVGLSAPGVETRIDENHEVLVRSPMNTLGYYKDRDATRALLTDDGFIRTGDLGELDSEGWLKLHGRIKEQFKTSKGKYISPSSIEGMLSINSAVESCIVMGSGLAAPFAIIVLSSEAQARANDAVGRTALEESLEDLLNTTNKRLEHHEQMKFVALVDSKWTVEKGYMTPTMKLKRAALEAYYAPSIETWLAQAKPIIWHHD